MSETFDLQTFASKLCTELGQDWTHEPPKERYDYQTHTTIRRTDQPHLALWLSTTCASQGKLYIAGQFPTYQNSNGLRYNATIPNITVSQQKTPGQVAKDINRRLMPTYLEMAERSRAALAEAKSYFEAKEATHAAIQASERAYDTAHRGIVNKIYLRASAQDKTTVELNLSNVPLAIAQQIIAMLP